MTESAVSLLREPDETGFELAERWLEMRNVGGFFDRLRAVPVEVGQGRMVMRCALDHGHTNLAGLVHGGVTAALVDMAGSGAAMTLIAPGEGLLTADLSIRYLAPGKLNYQTLTAEGQVSERMGSKMIALVTVRDGTNEVIAQGSVCVVVRPPRD
ncbi:TPA: PaaI family thioesterase [Pseudomonas aeruginosa]|uniref:PaaI family thioesterase n=1 Tax=Pseudomonas aeruginosa group TaxID=136841 RepID=UPI0012D8D4B5|nr:MULTISPECIES: PaaI family thioesterase [Pseudomonas aeruginosa group]MBH9459183.1 PaaI family thioesterase [Pseudomonas aeruginosa]MBH9465977.1 PaaI family thioesterase [Pseudomonas aeruginosa]MUI47062.1 hotdog fold thioesterase [Pseudomonas aeruginosa]QPZ62080.1 PaaI family thioesterase [Pseudomonas aeruginosa]HCF0993050.1 PaaI family thioesterase [Pseudomonas aeruginosa]